MPFSPSYGCCTRVNFVLKKHLLFQMNLSNSGLKNRSIKEYWLIFTILKFPLGLQFSHNLTKFKIIKYISTIYIMTTTCTYLQQLTQVSDVAHGPLVKTSIFERIGKKNNQSSFSDADREIPTLWSTDSTGNSVIPRFWHHPFIFGLGFLCQHGRPMIDSIFLCQ